MGFMVLFPINTNIYKGLIPLCSMGNKTIKQYGKREKVIAVYLSSEELEKIKQKAGEKRLGVSSFVRSKILENKGGECDNEREYK